jgi:DeoR/GlpR family transcriptional regulator of sugar metabolism
MIVAKKAAALIQDGDTIALNAGSTVELILDYIQGIKDVKIVTLGLNIAAKAAKLPGVDVYMPGGKLRKTTGAFYGMDTEAFLSQFNIDKCFFGALAVSEARGVTHPSIEEIETNQIILGISQHAFLVVDSSKFDKVSLMHMADLDQFDGVVADDEMPDKYRKVMEKNGIQIY